MRIPVAIAVVVALAAPLPGNAATYTISMKDPAAFSPKWISRAPMGSTFRFVNRGPDLTHNARLTPPVIPSFRSPTLDPGESWSKMLRYAGLYKYYCSIHGSEMSGAIGIPVRVAPTSGSTATLFFIRLATVDAPSGFVYDVQIKRNAGDWKAWKTGVKNDRYSFDPARTGTYYFRSRLRDVSPSRAIGYSPGTSIVVG